MSMAIEGQIYLMGHYLERINDTKKNIKYKLMNKTALLERKHCVPLHKFQN